jgi:radical SAM protein with 4Fe4S-binding SPASM domain
MTEKPSIKEDTLSRLYLWYKGKRAPPIKVEVYLTNACNLSCYFCPGSYQSRQTENELTKEEWTDVILSALDMGVREWWITGGGEPLMRSDILVKMVRLIKKHEGTFCMLTTNGTLFTKKIVEKLINCRIDKIYFSIDSPIPQIHDKLRGVEGCFQKAVDSIKLFSGLKKKFKKNIPKIAITAVLNKKNYKHLNKFVRFAKELGCEELKFQDLLIFKETYPFVKNLIIPLNKELDIRIRKAFAVSKEYGIQLSFDRSGIDKATISYKRERNSGNKFLSSFCFEPFYAMLIDSQGNVAPCCSWDRGEESLNVLKKSLNEIWYSEYFEYIRKRMISGSPFQEKEKCFSCGFIGLTNTLRKELTAYITTLSKTK